VVIDVRKRDRFEKKIALRFMDQCFLGLFAGQEIGYCVLPMMLPEGIADGFDFPNGRYSETCGQISCIFSRYFRFKLVILNQYR
jgi:hypothetical protein